jgi:hypothetical protein
MIKLTPEQIAEFEEFEKWRQERLEQNQPIIPFKRKRKRNR